MDLAQRPRMERRATSALLALLLIAVFLGGLAPSASAATNVTLASDTGLDSIYAGAPVTFRAGADSECASKTFVFHIVDNSSQAMVGGGPGTPESSGPDAQGRYFQSKFDYSGFPSAGSYTVSVDYSTSGCAADDSGHAELVVDVKAGLSGTISVTPDPPAPGQPATLSLATSGGNGDPDLTTIRWTVDGNAVAACDGKLKCPYTFPTARSYPVEVTFSDSAGNHADVKRTITAVTAAPPPPGSPSPPTPPPCVQELHFALSQFRTDGCFEKIAGSSPEQWVTTDQVRLNGVAFAATGQRFVITFPSDADPGGHIKTDTTAIRIDRFVPFSGDVDWSLPADNDDHIGTLREVAVPSIARLFKLRVAGSIAIKLRRDANDKYSATFPLNVELPPAFTAGPTKFAGGVSGAASIKVDDEGPHYDGLKLSVTDVWVGKLKIAEACFSYLPAGAQSIDACETPTIDDQPVLTCNTDVNTDRWDASAKVVLPTESETELAAYGGLANGQVSKLGAFVDKLGTAVPIVPGVFLNRIGFGLCVSPPPFQLRGDVGVNALGGNLTVNGRFLYTDGTETTPWRVEAGGNVSFRDTLLGDATVGFNAWGDVDFDVTAGLSLPSKKPGATEDPPQVVSITGNVNGWMEPRNKTFSIQGSVQACVDGLPCATALGIVSSTGIAGCLDLGTVTLQLPDEVREGPFGFGSITIITHSHTVHLQAGAGYRYGSKVDLLGDSCDLSPYAATASQSRIALAAGHKLSERIAPGARAVSLRIHGTNGPPKVEVRGPDGTTITSPAARRATQRKGHYILAENRSDGTTSVLLIKPAAGRWTIEAAPGGKSSPTHVDRSNYETPSVLFGQTRRTAHGLEAAVEYAVPRGASVQLAERAKGIGRTIARSLHGKRCRGTGKLPDGRVMLCARVRFLPSRGPGGTRHLEAIVSRRGIPLARKSIASFRAPRERVPSRPGPLRARRVGDVLQVAFPRSANASRYTVSVKLSDGREFGYDLSSSCGAVAIKNVPADIGASIRVAGVRYDLETGAFRSIALAAHAASAGSEVKVPRQFWRSRQLCGDVVHTGSEFVLSKVRANAKTGGVTLHVAVPGPGVADVLVTAADSALATSSRAFGPGPARFAFGRARQGLGEPGGYDIRVTPNARGRRALAASKRQHRPVVLNVWVTYTPTGGAALTHSRLHIRIG